MQDPGRALVTVEGAFPAFVASPVEGEKAPSLPSLLRLRGREKAPSLPSLSQHRRRFTVLRCHGSPRVVVTVKALRCLRCSDCDEEGSAFTAFTA